MRIIQIGAYMWGAQKIIEEGIHSCAIKKGYSSRILYVRGQSDVSETIRCENRMENIMTRGLRKLFGKRALFSTIQTMRIIYQLELFQPDIVHLHVIHGAINYHLLFSYLVKKQFPIVYTMHDMWAHTGGCYHTGVCTQYMSTCASCCRDCKQLAEEKENIKNAFCIKKKLLLQMNDLHCVAVSNWVAGEFQKGFLSARPISVIYNGIDQASIKNISSQSYNKNAKIHLICVSTSWDDGKGYNKLVELGYLLGTPFEVLIVGNVTEEQKKMNPGNMVYYDSCYNREELFSLYQNSDIHVTASQAETFGMTMVEAALAGIRSIGFSCTAIGEILSQVHGVTVDEFSANGLYKAVLNMVEQNNCKLSSAEINHIREKFSIRRMAGEYLSLYESMMRCVKDGEETC